MEPVDGNGATSSLFCSSTFCSRVFQPASLLGDKFVICFVSCDLVRACGNKFILFKNIEFSNWAFAMYSSLCFLSCVVHVKLAQHSWTQCSVIYVAVALRSALMLPWVFVFGGKRFFYPWRENCATIPGTWKTERQQQK